MLREGEKRESSKYKSNGPSQNKTRTIERNPNPNPNFGYLFAKMMDLMQGEATLVLSMVI